MKCTKAPVKSQYSQAKEQFLATPEKSFKELLPSAWMSDQLGNYRERVFSPLVTLQAFIEQILSADGSCKQAVARVLADRVGEGLEANSINTGPYCKARQRLNLDSLSDAVRVSAQRLEEPLPESWLWHGYRVKLVDGTTLQMPDTEANQARFPQLKEQLPGLGFPIVRVVGVFSLASGAVLDYALGEYSGKGTGEMSLWSRCLECFEPRDLMLGDQYYCAWGLLATLTQRDVPVLVERHGYSKVVYQRGQRLGTKDHVVSWKKPSYKPVWLSQADYDALPKLLSVREFYYQGKTFVTTLVDAQRFPKTTLGKLYKKRWKAELNLRTIKTDLGMEMLRCKSPVMVEKEIAVHFLAYNFIRAIIAQAAYSHQCSPQTVSFKATVQLLSAFRALLSSRSAQLYQQLQRAIVSTTIGQRIRPPQPRAVKRRRKKYSKLMEPRHLACQKLIDSYT